MPEYIFHKVADLWSKTEHRQATAYGIKIVLIGNLKTGKKITQDIILE